MVPLERIGEDIPVKQSVGTRFGFSGKDLTRSRGRSGQIRRKGNLESKSGGKNSLGEMKDGNRQKVERSRKNDHYVCFPS